jgi:copper chaperone CopZ
VLAKVDGVESEDTKPKETSCTVKGNFDVAKLVKALNDAGFHVTVEAGK